jgi:hypothetical protein
MPSRDDPNAIDAAQSLSRKTGFRRRAAATLRREERHHREPRS